MILKIDSDLRPSESQFLTYPHMDTALGWYKGCFPGRPLVKLRVCQHIDQLLWKAEVDLENVEDMYLRRETRH